MQMRVITVHPRLYEKIGISRGHSLNSHDLINYISTRSALPNPFSEYQLNLSTSRKFLKPKILRIFILNEGIFVVISLINSLIAYLNSRNLNMLLDYFLN